MEPSQSPLIKTYERKIMDTLLLTLEWIGTVAFAVSGAMTGLRKKLDILGVVMLGLTTATGGGIIRDVLLGITPPAVFRDPLTVITAVVTAILLFIPGIRHRLMKSPRALELTLLIADSIGLGVFTVVGAQMACRVLPESSWMTMAFLGVVTGVGGGLMRDVFVGDLPYIFCKHIYALAALVGALIWVAARMLWGNTAAMLLGCGAVVLIRLLAAHFRWNLPRAQED